MLLDDADTMGVNDLLERRYSLLSHLPGVEPASRPLARKSDAMQLHFYTVNNFNKLHLITSMIL